MWRWKSKERGQLGELTYATSSLPLVLYSQFYRFIHEKQNPQNALMPLLLAIFQTLNAKLLSTI